MKSIKSLKAIALTQTILSIAIGSIVVVSVATYYKATKETEQTTITKADALPKSETVEIGSSHQEGLVAGDADLIVKDVGSIDLGGVVAVAPSLATVNLSARSGSFSGTATTVAYTAPMVGGGGSVGGGVAVSSPGLGGAPTSSVGTGKLKKPKLATCGSPCSAVGGYAGWWTGDYLNGKPLCVAALPYCEPDPLPQSSCPWVGGGSAPSYCSPVHGGWYCGAHGAKPSITYKCK